MNLTDSIAPKSDQLNADDMIAGPLTVTIADVTAGNPEQPVNVHLVERPGRAYRPSKSMRRVIVAAWGAESDAYKGRRLTLYRNPDITFGKDKVGGIEIAAMSDLEKPITVPLTVTRGKKKLHRVEPLAADAPTSYDMPELKTLEEAQAHYAQRRANGASAQELAEIRSVGENLPSGASA